MWCHIAFEMSRFRRTFESTCRLRADRSSWHKSAGIESNKPDKVSFVRQLRRNLLISSGDRKRKVDALPLFFSPSFARTEFWFVNGFFSHARRNHSSLVWRMKWSKFATNIGMGIGQQPFVWISYEWCWKVFRRIGMSELISFDLKDN